MSLEENNFHIEMLILAYINAKHLLSTKQISKNDFFNKLEVQFQENGIHQFSKAQIISTWYRLVKKYELIKNNSPKDIKKGHSWPLYDIMDSCYDYSDFQFSPLTKFSDEMLWFLVDGVFRKRHYFKSQQQVALDDIYQEFLDEGYVDLTRDDVDARWKYLKQRYNKFKNCKEVLKRTPYLSTVGVFERNGYSSKGLVKMAFTKKLTEFLIKQFTNRKDSFCTHGYQHVPLFLEIQKELKKLGYNFSLAEIKGKWSSLTTVYDFLKVRVKHSPWIYFTAMKEHYEGIKKSSDIKRLMRKRSMSIGNSTNIPQSLKKLKKDESSLNLKQHLNGMYMSKNKQNNASKNKLPSIESNTNEFEEITNVSIDLCRTTQNPPARNVHIINIEQSDIDRKNGNITINLPSISKKFSDNEFLPLKKRLRLEQEKYKSQADIKDGFRGFSNTEKVNKSCDCARLTDAEMQEILDRAKKKRSSTNNTYSSVYTLPENYLQSFINSNRQYMLIPKEEEAMVDKIGSSGIGKSQMLVLVVKVDNSDGRKNGDCFPKTAVLQTIMEHVASTSVTANSINQENNILCSTYSYNIDEPSSNSISVLPNNQNEKCESAPVSIEFVKSALQSDSLQTDASFSFVPNTNSILETAHTEPNALYKSMPRNNILKNTFTPNFLDTAPLKAVNECDNISETVQVGTEKNFFENDHHNVDSSSESDMQNEVVVKESINVINNKKSVRLPVVSMNGSSITKEIFISPSELNKIPHMKQKTTSNVTRNEAMTQPPNLEERILNSINGNIQLVSDVIDSAAKSRENNNKMKNINKLKMIETNSSTGEITTECDDDASLNVDLLSTVINFHEQNMREFSDIKNLINVNNLLQRETNRMLQQMLEKM